MRKRMAGALLLLLIATAMPAGGKERNEATEEGLRKAFVAFSQAWVAGDARALASHLDRTDLLVTKTKMARMLCEETPMVSMPEVRKVKVFGDVGYVSAVTHLGKTARTQQEIIAEEIFYFKYRNEKWLYTETRPPNSSPNAKREWWSYFIQEC